MYIVCLQDIDWVQTEKHVFETATNYPFLVGLHSCFQTDSRYVIDSHCKRNVLGHLAKGPSELFVLLGVCCLSSLIISFSANLLNLMKPNLTGMFFFYHFDRYIPHKRFWRIIQWIKCHIWEGFYKIGTCCFSGCLRIRIIWVELHVYLQIASV